MSSSTSSSLAPFLDAVGSLDTESWRIAFDRSQADSPQHSAAMKNLKFSASESTSVRKAVKDTLRPNAARITPIGTGSFSIAVALTDSAAFAILDRGALSAEERAVLLAPFTAAGVPETAFRTGDA